MDWHAAYAAKYGELQVDYLENREMLKKIMGIVNEWDPIGFFPLAPEDEYVEEVKTIHDYMRYNQNLKLDILAGKINEIFLEAFGADVYNGNIEQCMSVAKQILKEETE